MKRRLEYLRDTEGQLSQLEGGTKARFITQLLFACDGLLPMGGGGAKHWGEVKWEKAELRVLYLKSSRSRLYFTDSYPDTVYVIHIIVTRSAPEAKKHRKVDIRTIDERARGLLRSRGNPTR